MWVELECSQPFNENFVLTHLNETPPVCDSPLTIAMETMEIDIIKKFEL